MVRKSEKSDLRPRRCRALLLATLAELLLTSLDPAVAAIPAAIVFALAAAQMTPRARLVAAHASVE